MKPDPNATLNETAAITCKQAHALLSDLYDAILESEHGITLLEEEERNRQEHPNTAPQRLRANAVVFVVAKTPNPEWKKTSRTITDLFWSVAAAAESWKNRYISMNGRHVTKSGEDVKDLQQAAVPHLYQAAVGFDFAGGAPFTAYAAFSLKTAIGEFESVHQATRVGRHARQKATASEDAEFQAIVSNARSTTKLDDPLSSDGDAQVYMDLLSDGGEATATIEERVEQKEKAAIVAEVVSGLHPSEAAAINSVLFPDADVPAASESVPRDLVNFVQGAVAARMSKIQEQVNRRPPRLPFNRKCTTVVPGAAVAPPVPTPRPHQREMIDAVVAELRLNGKAQLLAACGSGKTLVALWVVGRLNAQRVVFLAPTAQVLRQALQALASTGRTADLVVSDENNGAIMNGVETTTDTKKIQAVCNQNRWFVFCTYASSQRLFDSTVEAPQVVIYDEAHRLAGRDGRAWNGCATAPSQFKLFMTATPKVLTRRRNQDSLSMDDEAVFGRVACRFTYAEAVRRKAICDWKIMAVRTSISEAELDPEREEAAILGAVKNAIKAEQLRSVIVFRRTRQLARQTAALLLEQGGTTVLGDIQVSERITRLYRIAHQGGIVVTARAIGEGVDVPAVDGIVFLDKKRSVVDIVQAFGRAVRRDKTRPNKTAVVVVPIVVAREGSCETEDLSYLFETLAALRTQDERLARVVADASDKSRKKRRSAADQKYLETHGLEMLVNGDLSQSALADLSTLMTDNFEIGLNELRLYVEETGHAKVPSDFFTEEGFELGRWVRRRRVNYANGGMMKSEIEALETLPGWVWNTIEATWSDRLASLITFAEREGHTTPDSRAECEETKQLSNWARTQRLSYKRGNLSASQIARLEAVPHWDWKSGGYGDRLNYVTEAANVLSSLVPEKPKVAPKKEKSKTSSARRVGLHHRRYVQEASGSEGTPALASASG